MKIIMLFLLAILSSCNQFKTFLRVKPELVYENGLLISNSQTNPYNANIQMNNLRVNYNVVVKNASDRNVDLDLSGSSYKANDEQKSLECNVYGTELKKKTLQVNEQIAIACNTDISPNNLNKLNLKDTDILFSVSLNHSTHSFSYRVYAEEFVQ